MSKQDGNWGLEGMAGNCQPNIDGVALVEMSGF